VTDEPPGFLVDIPVASTALFRSKRLKSVADKLKQLIHHLARRRYFFREIRHRDRIQGLAELGEHLVDRRIAFRSAQADGAR
jgi:hypothetical protein